MKYFGENPKTTPPSVFFPVFVRFVKAYKVSRSILIFSSVLNIYLGLVWLRVPDTTACGSL